MKPNRWIFVIIAVVVIIWAVKVYAGTLRMTTYYPAPTGYYDTLKVRTLFVYPCYTSPPIVPLPGQAWAIGTVVDGCISPPN